MPLVHDRVELSEHDAGHAARRRSACRVGEELRVTILVLV
jgi:hypothetical protein